jgi:hypothetical protein
MLHRILLLLTIFGGLILAACSGQLGLGSIDTPGAPNQLSYDGAITLAIRNGQTLPGTNVGYQGKTSDGRALLTIGGVPAPKSTADSVNFTGSPIPGTLLTLNLRVGTYDSNTVNLLGTVHLVISDPLPQPGELASDSITAFGIPVQYSVNGGGTIPGSTVQYVGKTDQGAQFNNVGGFPYRQQFDSIVWNGHLRDKVALRLDLRLISYSEDSAVLVGTAQVHFEK